jgi:hypothetical protein
LEKADETAKRAAIRPRIIRFIGLVGREIKVNAGALVHLGGEME